MTETVVRATPADRPPHITLRAHPESAAIARRFAADVIADRPYDPYNVALIASELVTNAIRHARCPDGEELPIRLEIAVHDGHAHVSVTDPDTRRLPDRPPPADECGRGLAIVDAYTSGCWTVVYGTKGKTITACLPARDNST